MDRLGAAARSPTRSSRTPTPTSATCRRSTRSSPSGSAPRLAWVREESARGPRRRARRRRRSRPRPRGRTSAARAASTRRRKRRSSRSRRGASASRSSSIARSARCSTTRRSSSSRSIGPAIAGGVRALKGMSPIAKTRADEIVDGARDRGRAAAAAPRAAALAGRRVARAQRWAEMLLAIVQRHRRGDRHRAAPARDARGCRGVRARRRRAAASTRRDALPALATWRREVLGDVWRGWLAGRIALVGDRARAARHAPSRRRG